jgi:hypothetical protein
MTYEGGIHSCVGIHIILNEHNNGSWSYKKLIYKVCLNGTICENITTKGVPYTPSDFTGFWVSSLI